MLDHYADAVFSEPGRVSKREAIVKWARATGREILGDAK